jgi:hypothetical protein
MESEADHSGRNIGGTVGGVDEVIVFDMKQME